MKITVIGSINMDYSLKVGRLPQKGETLLAERFYTAAGGKGANQAVAARRLGADVNMIGAVGSDLNGKELISKLKAEGISVDGIKIVSGATGNAMITVDKSGANTIVVYPGANAKVDMEWVIANKAFLEEADAVILQLEIPIETVESAAMLAKKFQKKVILNPAPASEIPAELYRYIDVITPNETELEVLTGTKDVAEGAEILLQRGAASVVVTLGEKGCYYAAPDVEVMLKAPRVEAIDTTAAGDSFNAALAVALCEGKAIEEALQFSNCVGAITTTKAGAQEALPYIHEVKAFIPVMD